MKQMHPINSRQKDKIVSIVFLLGMALALGCSGSMGDRTESDTDISQMSTLRYFGAAGWEILSTSSSDGDSIVVLIDPYLTRAKYANPETWDPNDSRPNYSRNDTIFSDVDRLYTYPSCTSRPYNGRSIHCQENRSGGHRS